MTGQLKRTLELKDIMFGGVGYMIGAGIFTLITFVIKYGKGNAWLAFVLGSIISLLTGLSYARLNLDMPSNDAEYSWIRDAFTTKRDRDENTTKNQRVNLFAKIVIYAVMIMGILMNATISVSVSSFIKIYLPGISVFLLNFLVLLLPSLVNIFITLASILGISIVILLGLFVPKVLGENKLFPIPGNTANLIRASFITIFAYNGFQSLVQMSEEAKKESDIPRGMIGSLGITTVFYALIAISVIRLFGVKSAGTQLSPIASAYGLVFGDKAQHVVNILAITTMSSTLLLSILSRSRLLKKLSEIALAPSVFKTVTKNYATPMNAIVFVSFFSYIFTLFKQNALEMLANMASTLTFFIFSCVNMAVVYKFHKENYWEKNGEAENDDEAIIKKFKKMYPFYGIIGLLVTLYLFIVSPTYYNFN